MFSCEFCETFQNTFSTKHLWTTGIDLQILGAQTSPVRPSSKCVHVYPKYELTQNKQPYENALWNICSGKWKIHAKAPHPFIKVNSLAGASFLLRFAICC